MNWDKLADDNSVARTVKSMTERSGFEVFVVKDRAEAKTKLLELIPSGAQVMVNSSTTLDECMITNEIEEGTKYVSLRKKVQTITDKAARENFRRSACAAQYSIGSIHALTENGQALIASMSGSQLPSYVFAAANVIWVVGTQKIVKNLDEANRRIAEYVLPLEDERAKKVYGVGSAINKLLIVNHEIVPKRIKVILVKERLGF